MAADMNETEVKYDAPAGAALPRLDALPQVAGTSGPDEEQPEAEYYDTAGLRLMRAGITRPSGARPRRAPRPPRRCRRAACGPASTRTAAPAG
jgi:hypothetical protein